MTSTVQSAIPSGGVVASHLASNCIEARHLDPSVLSGQTAKSAQDGGDLVLIMDVVSGELRKQTRAQFTNGLGGSGGSGGESNTASNIGTAGLGIFDAKVGVDLQFRNLVSLSSAIGLNLNVPNKTIELSLVTANLPVMVAATAVDDGVQGVVPFPPAGAHDKFLRGDGQWATPVTNSIASASNVGVSGLGFFKQKTADNLEFNNIAAANDIITIAADVPNNLILVGVDVSKLPTFVGATVSDPGERGLVPAPVSADVFKFLHADGTWQAVGGGTVSGGENIQTPGTGVGVLDPLSDGSSLKFRGVGAGSNKVAVTLNSADHVITVDVATQNLTPFAVGAAGVVPAPLVADATKFLRGDGTWQDAGTGGGGGGSPDAVAPNDAQNILAVALFTV